MITEKDLKDEIHARRQLLIVDLKDYLPNFAAQHVQALELPDAGLYVPNELEPILRIDRRYYFRQNYAKLIPIQDFKELMTTLDDVLTSNGRLVFKAEKLLYYRSLFSHQVDPSIQQMKVAVAVVLQYLNQLCVYTNINTIQYNLGRLLKNEFRELAYDNTYPGYFHVLLQAIEDFVGKDTWHVYTYKLRGTKMYIEKQLDVRIHQWYDQKIELHREK